MDKYEGHTPGPWVAAWYGDVDEWQDGIGLGIVAVSNGGICEMQNRPEVKANAALIAAAPDLLAENKRLRAALEEVLSEANAHKVLHKNYPLHYTVLDKARAALAEGDDNE